MTLESIYKTYTDVAMLSKFSGGIGIAYHRVRSQGSLIKGTNGHSNGIVSWLKTLDSSVSAVNQGGKRKGACCVYLESWHADIQEFLEEKTENNQYKFSARLEVDYLNETYDLDIPNHVQSVCFEDCCISLVSPKLSCSHVQAS